MFKDLRESVLSHWYYYNRSLLNLFLVRNYIIVYQNDVYFFLLIFYILKYLYLEGHCVEYSKVDLLFSSNKFEQFLFSLLLSFASRYSEKLFVMKFVVEGQKPADYGKITVYQIVGIYSGGYGS